MLTEAELRVEIRRKWNSVWWRKDQYAEYHAKIGPRLNQAMEKVRELFNEEWARHALSHPMLPNVFAEGIHPLSNLFPLGDDLITLEGSKNLGRLIDELRGPGFHSAHLELMLAAQLKRCSHTIEFKPPVPGGREADFVAKLHPQMTYFEIKRLEEPDEYVYMRAATSQVIFALGGIDRELTARGWGHIIELEAEATRRITKADDTNRRAVITEIAEEVRKGLVSAARGNDHIDITIPGIARIEAGPGLEVSIGYQTFRPANDEIRRIIRKLKDGARQLHPEYPGIIAVQTPQALTPDFVQETEKLLDSEKFKHVVAVLVFPVIYALSVPWSKFPPFYVTKDRPRLPAIIVCAFSDLLPLFEDRVMTAAEFHAQRRVDSRA